MVDTHCHLYVPPLAEDPARVLWRARSVGVSVVVVPGVDALTSVEAVHLAEQFQGTVLAAVGVHPEVGVVPLDFVTQFASSTLVKAIGECGLDRGAGDLAAQERLLAAQVAIARDLDRPILLHCRGAFERLLRILEGFGPHRGILHAYNGSLEMATCFRRLGFYFGVGGVVTREEATRVRATFAAMPLDWLVLETDAPYIGTAKAPKGMVEPANLPEVLSAIAFLHRVPEEVVERVSDENAWQVLGMAQCSP